MQHEIEEQIQKKISEMKGVILHENNDKKSHEPTGSVGVV